MLVADAMTGQDAVNIAKAFNERVDISGVILSKMDGDARGGAALSIKTITGKPIKFIGVGEKLNALEPFHPDRIASRILGMGDILTLVEPAQRTYDKGEAEKMEAKMASGKSCGMGTASADGGCTYCCFVNCLQAQSGKVQFTTVDTKQGVQFVFLGVATENVAAAQAVAKEAYAFMSTTNSHCEVSAAKAERYPVNVRYMRELRDDVDKLKRVLIPAMNGAHIPLSQVADININMGPPGIRTENALLTTWIFVDVRATDIGGYVREAKAAIDESVKFPPGYYASWSGQYEYMERAFDKLKVIVPLTLIIIFLLLYLNFRSVTECFIILLAIPFSLIGAAWLLFILGYNLSIGVAVGFIALAGLDAEMGIIMLIYLDLSLAKRKAEGRLNTKADLKEAVMEGSVMRVRPKLMTIAAIIFGLLPIMWSAGTGAEVMKKIAASMVGGMFTSGLLELLVLPAIYALWKGRGLKD